jgi:pimeloyl-ACP methyl ester carboxylesterase
MEAGALAMRSSVPPGEPLPTLLIPGLGDSPRLFEAQIPVLWRFGPVMVADHTRDERISALAARVLAHAPARFALAGLSMGGYAALEIMRQAPERVLRLALLDTSARPDTEEATQLRLSAVARAERGEYQQVTEELWPRVVHTSRVGDQALRQRFISMHLETGAEAYVRQQRAIISRPDSRPDLSAIQCPTLVVVGDDDRVTPLALAQELAQGIAGARLVVVPDSGHLSAIEQPATVSDALASWLSAPAH